MKFLCKKTVTILTLLLTISQCYMTFDQFNVAFERNYTKGESEYEFRKNIYDGNVASFTNTTYQMAVNNFTDRTPQEIEAYKNLKVVDVGKRLGRPKPLRNRLGYPVSVDWRAQGAVTSVKSQGSCGACWAFATAAAAESKVIIQKRFTNTTINLSEQFLLSCTPQSTCNGGYFQYSMPLGRNLPSETVYPYTPYKVQDPKICQAASLNIAPYNYDYYDLSQNDLIALLQAGPVAISVDSTNWEFYGSGIFTCPGGSGVNHAVLLVGYTSTYWIIKNQWGPGWGNSGYIYVSKVSAAKCSIGHSAHIFQGAGDTSNDKYFIVGQNSTIPTNTTTNSSSSTNNKVSLFSNSLKLLTFTIMLLFFVMFA